MESDEESLDDFGGCQICDTNDRETWDSMVLCDRCDAEFHSECLEKEKLKLPTTIDSSKKKKKRRFVCHLCDEEVRELEVLFFLLDVIIL